MNKKILIVLLCSIIVIGLATGCGKENKESLENNNKIEENNSTNEEDINKEPFKYMVCSGSMKLDKYDSAKDLKVEWTGEFDSSKNLIDFSGVYVMSFEDNISSEIVERNKKLLEDNYCNNVFSSKEFTACSVKVENRKIYVNATFDLEHIDSSELSAIREDQENLYKLLPVHLEKIDNDQTCEGKN